MEIESACVVYGEIGCHRISPTSALQIQFGARGGFRVKCSIVYRHREQRNMGREATPAISIEKLGVLTGLLFIFGPLGTDAYLAGFGAIAGHFQTDIGKVQISLTAYLLGLTIGQLLYGPLTGRFGRRRPLLIGIGVFVAVSFILMAAPGIASFIVLRAIQGLGGCAGIIIGRAMAHDLYEREDAARVFSTLDMVQGFGPIVAAPLGSFLIAGWGWRSAFILMGAYGCFGLASAAWGLGETLPPSRRRRVSVGGALDDYLAMLRRREFIAPALAGTLAGSSLFAYLAGSSFVFIELHGLSEQQFGLIFMVIAFALPLSGLANRLLLRKFTTEMLFRGVLIADLAAIAALLALTGRAPRDRFGAAGRVAVRIGGPRQRDDWFVS